MRSQRIADGRERTFALVLDTGDELMESLRQFAAHEDLSAASFTAIGAFSDALLAWFDWEQREYQQFSVSEQVEVLTLEVILREAPAHLHERIDPVTGLPLIMPEA